ncbi:MAG: hypothetical protein H6970_04275 [Gammaproteobacteria bacterium]|nr:hypothetical protein [Gammaproteobacteria bacterium]MCP5424265.1 hypothetical protein [Gammaproteobacteria bacterium]
MTPGREYLRRAARCYLQAGLLDEACRCFERLPDARQAALLHERQRRWAQAAAWYERVPAWKEAARNHERCEQYEAAAQCWLQAGERLLAAWTLADRASRISRVRELLSGFEPAGSVQALELRLIRARCLAGEEERPVAARCLRDVVAGLADLDESAARQRPVDWAVRVAEALRRPDLAALTYATAVQVGISGSSERWTAWARDTLGDVTGIPMPVV